MSSMAIAQARVISPPSYPSAISRPSSTATLTNNISTLSGGPLTIYKADFDGDAMKTSNIWVEIEPGKYRSQTIKPLDPTSELHEGRISQAWYKRAQFKLKTIMIVSIVMACVSAQILTFTMASTSGLEHTMAICFAALGLFFTTLASMYGTVTYIWLRPEWTPHATKFDEWVTSSTSTMIVWSGVGLVIGVYSGFLATACFLFAVMHHTLAMVCTCIFVVASISPMIWGLYRWQGLYTHTLVWKSELKGPTVMSAHKADRSDYV